MQAVTGMVALPMEMKISEQDSGCLVMDLQFLMALQYVRTNSARKQDTMCEWVKVESPER